MNEFFTYENSIPAVKVNGNPIVILKKVVLKIEMDKYKKGTIFPSAVIDFHDFTLTFYDQLDEKLSTHKLKLSL